AAVSARFASKHRDRAAVLERKLQVQRGVLALASREPEEITTELRASQPDRHGPTTASEAPLPDVPAAGGVRPALGIDAELNRLEAERKLHEAAVDAQLAHLKKKLGRE